MDAHSILILIFITLAVVVSAIQALWLPKYTIDLQLNYFYYLGYFMNQLLPFVIVGSLPQMKKRYSKIHYTTQKAFS